MDKEFESSSSDYSILKCDQSSIEDLKSISLKLRSKQIGLILDDGSHIPEHQIMTFNILFDEILPEGGVYIIEDIETSYWRNHNCYGYKTNYGISSYKSLIVCFSKLINWVNREFLSSSDKAKLKNQLKNSGFDINTINMIESIYFGHNCICIKKMKKEDLLYSERDYKYKKLVSKRYSPFILTYNIAPNSLKKYLRKLAKFILRESQDINS